MSGRGNDCLPSKSVTFTDKRWKREIWEMRLMYRGKIEEV